MDPVTNPFQPGAGSQPPELSGRASILRDAETAIQRVLIGNHDQSQILIGLRGTGKTVLLNTIEGLAQHHKHYTTFLEAEEKMSLAERLYPGVVATIHKLSFVDRAKARAEKAMRAARSFAAAFRIKALGVGVEVKPEPGVADTGSLELDLPELFQEVGEAAQAAGRAWSLCIDELQFMERDDLASLIMALHRCSQRGLPVLFFGAGLPLLAKLTGEAKAYSERLFLYADIGPLTGLDARAAIQKPIEARGAEISDTAIDRIITATRGYPYFLQEWGKQVWNTTEASPISLQDVERAAISAQERLDEGFFKVRMAQMPPSERAYISAMAHLGAGPYPSADIAAAMRMNQKQLNPRRAALMKKGLVYSPARGFLDFTVPMFDDHVRRRGI